MRVLVQRSLNSSVSVDGKVIGSIDKGLVLLVGFTEGDDSSKIDYLVKRVLNLRIFDDENGVMNKSILDVGGSILSRGLKKESRVGHAEMLGKRQKAERAARSKALKWGVLAKCQQ